MTSTGEAYAVFCGLDVGKSEHHACALNSAGRRLHDKALPNDEIALRKVFTSLGKHGRVLAVVDQPASIGALAIAVARDMGIDIAYLPGLAMRRIADLYPGQAKTDARDAFIIADAARTMPHTLRRSAATTRPSPDSASWPATTTTSANRRPGCPTGSAMTCSISIPPWNGY